MENFAPQLQTSLRNFTKYHGNQQHTFGKAMMSQICFICKEGGENTKHQERQQQKELSPQTKILSMTK